MYKQPTHRYTASFKSNYYRVTYLRGYKILRIVKNYALNRIYNEKLSRMLSKWYAVRLDNLTISRVNIFEVLKRISKNLEILYPQNKLSYGRYIYIYIYTHTHTHIYIYIYLAISLCDRFL